MFEDGLWAPAPSELTYEIGGAFARFTAKVLISAFKGDKEQIGFLEKELGKPRVGTVRFQVMGDGRILYESDVISYASGAKDISVDIKGVRTLVLRATEADGSDLLDFAVWADGELLLR